MAINASIKGSGNMPVLNFTVDIVKGWTRATCVAWIMLALSDMDLELETTKACLKPLEKVVDRAWMLPQHATGLRKDIQF